MKRRNFKGAFKALLAGLLLTSFANFAHATVCRLPGLDGFESAKARAERTIGKDYTRRDSRIKLYIEMTDAGPYYHSNFISRGHDHATKIGREDIYDLEAVLMNVIHTSREDALAGGDRLRKLMESDIEIHLDTSMIREDGSPKIDLGNATNIRVVDGKSGSSLGTVRRLDRNSPPPLLMTRALGCCFYGIPPHIARQLTERLRLRSFNRKRVKIQSLVSDSATTRALEGSKVLSKVRAGERPRTKSALIQQIQASAGETMILVGHREGNQLVTRNAANKVEAAFEIAELNQIARESGTELIVLGCETARSIDAATYGVGVVNKFNTVEAIGRLEGAVRKSRNFAEFFENLSGEGLTLVAGREVLKHQGNAQPIVRGTVYAKIKDASSRVVKAASIYLLGKNSEFKIEATQSPRVASASVDQSPRDRLRLDKPLGLGRDIPSLQDLENMTPQEMLEYFERNRLRN